MQVMNALRPHLGAVAGLLSLAVCSGQVRAQCADIPPNPQEDAEGAGFGSAVAISADGMVALAAGPGFDLGDGLVRTFQRVAGEWVEGLAIAPFVLNGENFGADLAMSDDGSIAVITAPREVIFSPSFQFAAGAAYLYERDAGTGQWTNTQRWQSPTPGFEQNFGASCDIAADGSVIVIGETNQLGSDWQSLPDAAWIISRVGETWSEPVRLMPSPAVDATLNFGHKVAISDDATLIAVGAPLAGSSGASGQVHIFEDQDGTWVHSQVLTRLVPGDSFNQFGDGLEFDGDSLLTTNPLEGGFLADPPPPVCVYHRDGGMFPTAPDELVYLSPGSRAPGSIVVRADAMVVGSIADGHAVHRFTRTSKPGGPTWQFDAVFRSDDEPFPGFNGYGYGFSVAFANDPEIMIVGEPRWSQDFGLWQIGRIHFPDRVFGNADFQIPEASSSMFVDFDFPGMPLQQLFVQLLGFFNLQFPMNCNGGPIPIEAVLENFTITTTEPEHVLEGPLGIPITLSQVEISLAAPSNPAPVDAFGSVVLTGMTVHVQAMVQVGKLKPFMFAADGEQTGDMPATITGGTFGQPVVFQIPNLELDFSPDLGLGANNPVISAQGSVTAQGPMPCAADIIHDGQLDFFDVQAFLNAFASQTEPGDWNDDFFYDFFDVQAFLNDYATGCP